MRVECEQAALNRHRRFSNARMRAALLLSVSLAIPTAVPAGSAHDTWRERSLPELRGELASGKISSFEITRRYLSRVAALNPRLHAVIAVNPDALAAARRSDARRAAGMLRGPDDGLPILVKDNIDIAGMATTAGSRALIRNVPSRSAPLIEQLLAAGFIVLGKTNLSEWANIRSNHSTSGWSAIGGLTRNPYVLDRSACGSSSGSAASVAADLAPLAIGTETDGSITCPAAVTGLVGLKPTVGLVSQAGIVPISHSQDTAGPMARSVADAAALMSVIADTAERRLDYTGALRSDALRGKRIGVMRFLKPFAPRTRTVFDQALDVLRGQGAILVDIDGFDFADMGERELTGLLTEFKAGLAQYLTAAPDAVSVRTLAQLIEFNRADPVELAWFDQDLFETAAAAGERDAAFMAAQHALQNQAGRDGIDRLLHEANVVALVAPTEDPAWISDWLNGDSGGPSAGRLPAVAGYPHLTVPMGRVEGLPVGISFIGAAWSEPLLLSLGYAYEQASHARKPPLLRPTLPPMTP